MATRLPALAFFLPVALLAGAACSKLTEPPKQEAIATDPTTAGSVAGSAGASANPHGDPHGADKPNPQPLDSTRAQLGMMMDAGPEKPLVKTILTPGKGPEAKEGDTVKVHYVGTLTDGKEFDSSRKRNEPFQFKLGAGNVIKGWDQGVAGMKVGEKRKLTIPPSLGYGSRNMGAIPPNSTLVFEVELVEVVGKK